MAALFPFFNSGRNARVVSVVPKKLVSKMVRKTSGPESAKCPVAPIPALLIRMSRPPKCDNGGIDHLLPIFRLADIGLDNFQGVPILFQRLLQCSEQFQRTSRSQYLGPAFGSQFRKGPAYAL